MKRILIAVAIILGAMQLPQPIFASDTSPDVVSAGSIRPGCLISFSKQFHPDANDPLSTPRYDVVATWKCRGTGQTQIDRYGVNGASPEVVTVLYWKKRNVVVLVRWSINSRASDYVGDYYRVFIYRVEKKAGQELFVRDDTAMKEFPADWDGYTQNGLPVRYPFKDAASIRRRLSELHFDE